MNVLKPWYLYQPTQVWRRLLLAIQTRPKGPQIIFLPNGIPIEIDPDQYIGRQLLRNGVYDIAVAEALCRLVDPGDFAIDIGANIGYTAALMGPCLGQDGRILALEPHPTTFQKLKANISGFRLACNTFAEIEARPIAASHQTGSAMLHLPTAAHGNDGLPTLETISDAANSISIQTVRLDELVADHQMISLMKLDVEGHEHSVLTGAARLLQERRIRHLVYEDHLGPSSPVTLALQGYGYSIYLLSYDLHGPVMSLPDEATAISRYEVPNYLATVEPLIAARKLHPRGWKVFRKI